MRREYSDNFALLEGLASRLNRQRQGIRDEARAHIRHLARPAPAGRHQVNRFGEAWAAVSLSLLLLSVVGLMFAAPHYLGAGLAITTILFLVIESVLRRAFIQTVSEITALLAIAASLILLVHFWYGLLIGALVAVALFLFWQRLRELAG